MCFEDEQIIQQPKNQRRNGQDVDKILQEALHLYHEETINAFSYTHTNIGSWQPYFFSVLFEHV